MLTRQPNVRGGGRAALPRTADSWFQGGTRRECATEPLRPWEGSAGPASGDGARHKWQPLRLRQDWARLCSSVCHEPRAPRPGSGTSDQELCFSRPSLGLPLGRVASWLQHSPQKHPKPYFLLLNSDR